MNSLRLTLNHDGQPQFTCRRPVHVRVERSSPFARRYRLEAEGTLYPDGTFEVLEYVFVRRKYYAS